MQFLKFKTLEQAETAQKKTIALVDFSVIVCPPIPVYDGTFAIEKLTGETFGGEVVESIEPPVEKQI